MIFRICGSLRYENEKPDVTIWKLISDGQYVRRITAVANQKELLNLLIEHVHDGFGDGDILDGYAG